MSQRVSMARGISGNSGEVSIGCLVVGRIRGNFGECDNGGSSLI
jgi:hypothetical protein